MATSGKETDAMQIPDEPEKTSQERAEDALSGSLTVVANVHAAINNSGSAAETNEGANLTAREIEVLKIYRDSHRANKHKMEPIPVCKIPGELR